MRKWAIIGIMLLGAGCAKQYDGPPPELIDARADAVTIQSASDTRYADVLQAASEGCAIHGRSPTSSVTRACLDEACGRVEHVFGCK